RRDRRRPPTLSPAWLLFQGKMEPDDRTPTHLACQREPPAMRLGPPSHEGQADPAPLRLGGEEAVEGPLARAGAHPDPGVFHREEDLLAFAGGSDGEGSTLGHGFG